MTIQGKVMYNLDEIIEYSKTLNLLYVEDNTEARETTCIILEEFFKNIILGVNGEDGLEKFKTNSIDLVITDINMPRLNGLDMIRKIRETNTDVPILILSAYNESDFFIDSIKLGVEGYLLKPIDMKQFLGVMSKVVEKLALKKEVEKHIHFLHQYQEATDRSTIVSKSDLDGIITYVNDEFCKISGYSRDELIGRSHNITRHPDNSPLIYENLWDTIKNKKKIYKGVIRNITKNGKSYYVKMTIKPILDINNNIIEYIAIRDDITQIMNQKKQFGDAVEALDEPLIVYMRLEEFDILEEFYDDSTVEMIQDEIASYLENNMPKTCNFDRVYRLGSGEYAMVNETNKCLKNTEVFTRELKAYQEKIREDVVYISDVDYDMAVIISLAYGKEMVLEDAKLGIKKLLKNRQDFIIANGLTMKEQNMAQRNMETLSMIKSAVNNYRIISYFQPIINNKTQKVEKYESLVRLIDEEDKVLSPFFFLETAKKGKYYSQITDIVLENSFSVLEKTDKDITINLSALDIEKKATREKIFSLLKRNRRNTGRIVFELLEDEAVKDFKVISDFIDEVKEMDVKIAIDDFGSGYSNFERLMDYKPDILKIDGSLIKNIETNSYSLSVVKTIIAFAKEQNIKTVGEFVENRVIYEILSDLGVDYSQGYYFGKPMMFKDNKKEE